MDKIDIMKDPAFRGWVQSLVDEARKTGVLFPDEVLEEIENANRAPNGFDSNPELVTVLRSLYSEVVKGGLSSELRISAQPFARDFRLWQDPVEVLRAMFDMQVQPGPGRLERFDLFRRYPDLSGDAISMMKKAEELSTFVSSAYLRNYLSEIASSLERIASEGIEDPTSARSDIEMLGKSVKAIASILTQAEANHLYAIIPHVIESALLAGDLAEGEEGEMMKKALWQLERSFEVGHSVARLRELSLEVQIRAWTILNRSISIGSEDDSVEYSGGKEMFVEVGEGDPEVEAGRLAEEIYRRDGTPTLEEMATLAWLYLSVGKPAEAVRAVKEFGTGDSAAEGAAFLLAAWRQRLKGGNPSLESAVFQGIRNALFMERAALKGPEAGDHYRAPWLEIPLVGELPAVVGKASEAGDALYVEFGPGEVPVGLEYAKASIGSHLISVEPDVRPIDWSAIDVTYPPRNFTFLMGSAEEMAAFAADEPFADGVVMVAPTDESVMKLVISALMVTKPGGEIKVFQGMGDLFPAELLSQMGFGIKVYALDPRTSRVPPSKHLNPDEPVRLAKVIVPKDGEFGDTVFADGKEGALRDDGGPGKTKAASGKSADRANYPGGTGAASNLIVFPAAMKR